MKEGIWQHLLLCRDSLKGVGLTAVAEGGGPTIEEHDVRRKSPHLGRQCRAQEALRQDRRATVSNFGSSLWGGLFLVGQRAEEGNPVGVLLKRPPWGLC